jgi:hypothetical protein
MRISSIGNHYRTIAAGAFGNYKISTGKYICEADKAIDEDRDQNNTFYHQDIFKVKVEEKVGMEVLSGTTTK